MLIIDIIVVVSISGYSYNLNVKYLNIFLYIPQNCRIDFHFLHIPRR